jgi:predicted permease
VAPAILSDPSSADGKSPEEKRKELITRIFSPPVVGSLMGLLVGSVPFARQILISPAGALNWFFSAMGTLGAAYLPAVLLVLAGSLTPARDAAEEAAEQAKSPAVRSAESRAFFTQISSIYAARYALMPLVGFFLVATIRRFVPSIDRIFGADPLLVFILLLETCMPSAQNSTVILQLQNKKTAAARMARVLMLVYILGIPALSYWLVRVLSATSLL